jgi:antitoxin component YwqK of YwqJK toxin-antitoxin module
MPRAKPHIHRHKDGSIWAKGQMLGGAMTGYWEWFRKDGTRMRSGSFENGKQAGEWTTYDREGKVHKVTAMKPSPAKRKTRKPAAKE